ncbi:MAG TPA: ABC transporter substrate-binding protein [Dongiaceae bacterium]|nr:ABC transporter substrate-binding protein [Dongiaceae bacterium]
MLLQWFRLVTALITGLLIISPAAAADTPSAFGCDLPIRIAFAESGALYHQGVGIDQDVITEIAARTGCKFDPVALPREQIWRQFNLGALDMTTGARKTAERAKIAYFVPYIGLKTVIVSGTGVATQIRSFDDVLAHADWRIGIVSGFFYGAYYEYRLHGLREHYRIIVYPDQQKLYNGLQHNDIQVILSQSLNYAFYLPLDRDQQNFVMFDASPSPPAPYHLVFRRDRFTPTTIDAWTRVIEQMRLDGTLEKIYRRRVSADMARFLLNF